MRSAVSSSRRRTADLNHQLWRRKRSLRTSHVNDNHVAESIRIRMACIKRFTSNNIQLRTLAMIPAMSQCPQSIHDNDGRRRFLSSSSSSSSPPSSSSSSSSSSASIPEKPPSYHSKTVNDTNQLLDLSQTPLGSFDDDTMVNANGLLEDWIRIQSKYSAEQATKILYRIVDENREGNPYAFFNKNVVESLLLLWREVSPTECPSKALTITEKIRTILDDEYLPYNNMIAVLAKCRSREAAVTIEGFLHQMIRLQNDGLLKDGTADVITFNSAISSWMHIAKEESDAGKRAVAILNRMKGMYRLQQTDGEGVGDGGDGDDPDDNDKDYGDFSDSGSGVRSDSGNGSGNNYEVVIPNLDSFRMAMRALLTSEGSKAAMQADCILQDFLYFYDECWAYDDTVKLTDATWMFEDVLRALNVHSRVNGDAVNRALSLLKFMEDSPEIHPSVEMYAFVTGAISGRKGRIPSTDAIEQIIQRMNDIYYDYHSEENDTETDADAGVAKVNTMIYNHLIRAYVRSGNERKAEEVLMKMKREFENGNEDVKPTSDTWNAVISAYAKSSSKHSSDRASKVMAKMSDFGKIHKDVQPNIVTISSMMDALARKARRDKKAGRQAVQILNDTIAAYEKGVTSMKPDRIMFSQVINCIAQIGGAKAGSSALEILRRMRDMYKGGDEDFKPDTVTLNSVLLALANTRSESAAERAEKLLQGMIDMSDPFLAPTVTSYTTVISAWANSGSKNATERAEKILLGMENSKHVEPNTRTYATVLKAFARGNDASSVDLAMKLLQRMEDGKAKAKPNAYCYGSAMDCIANFANNQSVFSQVEPLLRRIIDNPQNRDETERTESFTVVFNTALKAIQKSPIQRKDEAATRFVDLMEEADASSQEIRAPPSSETYNLFIRACAFTKGDKSVKKAAFYRAMEMLKKLRSSEKLQPDTYTYPAAFRAGEELLSDSEEDLKLIRELFTMCCEDGLVSGLLLKNMNNFLPRDFLSSLLDVDKHPSEVKLNDLPNGWRKRTSKFFSRHQQQR